FKKSLSDWSIQKKLIYSNVFGIAFAFVPVVVIMVTYEYFALRESVLEEIRVQAEITGESSAAAMAFRDTEAAHDTLSALRGAHDMREAHLILSDGTILESYYGDGKGMKFRKPTKKFQASKERKERLGLSSVTIEKPIFLRSEHVGSLILVSSLNSLYTRLEWFALIIMSATLFGFMLARMVAKRISKMITEPLMELIEATQKVTEENDYSTPISVESKDEVGNLSRAFGEMMTQIHNRDLTMQQLAYYDRVSGIPNRHFFEERIVQAISNAQRYGTSCYLLMIDLDDFKIVNDTIGHHVGDLLLRHVSESLTNTMRQNDSIFRIGGDEFAIIIESISDHESVAHIAQKIIKAVSTPVVLEGHEVKVGASIGISCFPKYSSDVQTLMSTADSAMYAAKGKGKNNYQTYNMLMQ
ncbi:diguanylate cyclase domain-containing protein, partial [Sulfuricurvum sp.]|uniref:diguanylate cyclase domain-containing protein n=1 Tax=Sulfuricurvum sp. TaxID=2025608 RepID=UPI002E34E404